MVNQYSEDELLSTFYTRALGSEDGKKVKEDLFFYIHRMSHTPGDTYATAFKEGERSLALRILQLCGEIK